MKYEIAAVHDLAGQRGAGVLVISGAHALLCQRGDNADNPGTWAPFGGMVDPGESTEEAARRELGEESGLWLNTEFIHLYDSQPTEEGFVFSTYVTFVEDRPLVDLEREESSGYGWFSLLSFPTPRHPGFNAMLKSDEWRAMVDSLDLGESLDLMPGEDRLPAHATMKNPVQYEKKHPHTEAVHLWDTLVNAVIPEEDYLALAEAREDV